MVDMGNATLTHAAECHTTGSQDLKRGYYGFLHDRVLLTQVYFTCEHGANRFADGHFIFFRSVTVF